MSDLWLPPSVETKSEVPPQEQTIQISEEDRKKGEDAAKAALVYLNTEESKAAFVNQPGIIEIFRDLVSKVVTNLVTSAILQDRAVLFDVVKKTLEETFVLGSINQGMVIDKIQAQKFISLLMGIMEQLPLARIQLQAEPKVGAKVRLQDGKIGEIIEDNGNSFVIKCEDGSKVELRRNG